MKSYLVLLWALFLSTNLLYSNPVKNSLGELKAENELAQRIEKNLSNVVEKSIVFVDLDLKYNLFNPSSGDLKLDQNLSLPGLPVGKTENSVPNIDLTDYAPTEITKINISVRVPNDTDETILKQIEDIVIKTSSMDLLGNDELLVTPDLPVLEIGNSIFTYQNFIILIALFLIFIIINNMKSSTKIIAKSLRRIKISNLEQLKDSDSRDFKFYGNSKNDDEQSSKFKSDKPIQVKLIKEDEAVEDTNLDFLNELSNSIFLSIIKNENPKEIAYILTQVEPKKVDYFFKFYDGSTDEVIKNLLTLENILQLDIKIMVVGMYQKYLEALEKNPLKINNIKTLVSFINSSSLVVAQKLFDKIKELNPEIAEEVKKKIFLLDDILTLKNVQIEQINSEFEHLEMVQFLKCLPNNIKQKFFSQLSERAVMILKEDMEIIGTIPEDDIDSIINHSLSKIRYILNY